MIISNVVGKVYIYFVRFGIKVSLYYGHLVSSENRLNKMKIVHRGNIFTVEFKLIYSFRRSY